MFSQFMTVKQHIKKFTKNQLKLFQPNHLSKLNVIFVIGALKVKNLQLTILDRLTSVIILLKKLLLRKSGT